MRRMFLFMVELCICGLFAASAYAAALPPEQRAFIARAKEIVAHDLFDPSSAQWRGTYLHKYAYGVALCGEINAKNRSGGYVGFRRFYVNPSINGRHDIENRYSYLEPSPTFDDRWTTACEDGDAPHVSVDP